MQTIYRVATIILILISCLVVGIFYVVTTKNIERIYATDTEEAIYALKQDFLQDTVNNQIQRIDARRNVEIKRYEQAIVKTEDIFLTTIKNSTQDAFIQFFANHFTLRSSLGVWSAVLWDKESSAVLVDTKALFPSGVYQQSVMEELVDDFIVYRFSSFGPYEAFYGVTREAIDTTVKEAIAAEIHASEFSEDSYLWINEIINYNGGDNYAIRRVHPNLPDTEGMYLSTSMTDIAGNFPYLEELEGIREDGEIIFTYFFKRKNSQEIAEKLTYAKLYKEYDWIVAMGIHLADMDDYIEKTTSASSAVTSKMLPLFIIVLVVLISGGSIAIVLLENWRQKSSRKALEEQANRDMLTKAFNRRMGLYDLSHAYKRFSHANEVNPAVILFDIDNFKQINDTFGHAEGDRTLQLISNTILSIIRVTDRLYRWGGDEFLILCEGVRTENIELFCTSILSRFTDAIADEENVGKILTISMGVSYFHTTDKSYQEVVERADEALYRAKRNGKNRVELSL